MPDISLDAFDKSSISVHINGSVATLTGFVDHDEQKSRAAEIVSSFEGVEEVKNGLFVLEHRKSFKKWLPKKSIN